MRIGKRDALKTPASFGLDKQDHYKLLPSLKTYVYIMVARF